jgi:ribonuclease D
MQKILIKTFTSILKVILMKVCKFVVLFLLVCVNSFAALPVLDPSIVAGINESYVYIDTTAELKRFCKKLKEESEIIAVDTEFVRYNKDSYYFPVLCLIQIATPEGHNALIDPLARGLDFSALADIFCDASKTKVFHAAKTDLELLSRLFGPVDSFANIWDTQMMALASYGENDISYKKLVKQTTGLELDKSSQRSNWRQRPLTDDQRRYAIHDVTYLAHIYPLMREYLEKQGKLCFVEAEIAALRDSATYERVSNKTFGKLCKDREIADYDLLRKLALVRNLIARRNDLPPHRIICDDRLVAMSCSPPINRKDFISRFRWLTYATDDFMSVIEKHTFVPPVSSPELDMGVYRTMVSAVKNLLNKTCKDEEIAPMLLFRACEVDVLVREFLSTGNLLSPSPLMTGWREGLIGADLRSLCRSLSPSPCTAG